MQKELQDRHPINISIVNQSTLTLNPVGMNVDFKLVIPIHGQV